MISDYPISRIFCFVGAGANGKTSYLELLERLIGENNCTSTELDVLMISRFEITRLHKKLVCRMGETNYSELNKTSKLKQLTGKDPIGFEYKNKTPFKDKNYAKILIATNSLPDTNDKTIGFYRRWILIDFPNTFDEKEDVLSYIPEQEYNNLAFRCIFLLQELLKNRQFTKEGSIEERKKRYEERSNYFDKFWNEHIIENSINNISKKEFREKFNSWCKENRHRELSDITIKKNMEIKGIQESKITMTWIDSGRDELGNVKEKPRMWVWDGISWK